MGGTAEFGWGLYGPVVISESSGGAPENFDIRNGNRNRHAIQCGLNTTRNNSIVGTVAPPKSHTLVFRFGDEEVIVMTRMARR